MKQINSKLLSFFMVILFTTMSISAFAASNKYAKAIATATGEGKVYVGTSDTTPAADAYQETSEATNSKNVNGSANVDFYLFAQPNASNIKFDGWYDNEECTGAALSTDNPYTVIIQSNQQSAANAVTKNYYAKFVEASVFYSSTMTVSCVGEGGTVAVSTESGNEDFGAEKSASNLKDVEAAHTYYLQAKVSDADHYRFLGWYSDEACQNQLSKDANYTYKVTAESTDEANPTQFHAYAKFELIIVFSCSKDRLYLNVGDEAKANDGLTCKNTTNTGYTSSNTAVATVAEDGKVTPISAGSTIITVSADGFDNLTYVATILDYSQAGSTQIGNGDFEDWSNVTNKNHAPNNWNSFETAETNWLTSLAKAKQVEMSDDHRPGSNGLYCAKISSRSVWGTNAQGNLTLGCINAGSTTAADKNNHNFSDINEETKSETISKVPTALKCWVKFEPDNGNQDYEARVAATVHDKFNYITYGQASDDNESNKEHVVASAEQNFKGCDWTELTIPFTLSGNAVLNDQLYIVVNFSTNKTPGGGSANDHLFIDDVELVYDTEYDKVPVTVSDAQYATFVAPFDVKMPDAITANTVETVGTEAAATQLKLDKVVDNVVPANTPVILNADEVQNRIAYGVANPEAAPKYGLLTGVYTATQAQAGWYVLQNNEDKVGFYKVADKKPTVGANRCYLTVPEEGPTEAPAFFFGGEETTAIEALDALTTGVAEIYTLDGMKVGKLQRGINIVKLANGKTQKVMVK